MNADTLIDIFFNGLNADILNNEIAGMGESPMGRLMDWQGDLPDSCGAMDLDAKVVRLCDKMHRKHALFKEVEQAFVELRSNAMAYQAVAAWWCYRNGVNDSGKRNTADDIAEYTNMSTAKWKNEMQFVRRYLSLRLAHLLVKSA